MDNLQTREERIDSMLAVFTEKLEHINITLSNILTKLDKNDEELKKYVIEITNIKNMNEVQQKEIEEIKKSTEYNKRWWLGITSAILVSFIIALLKLMGLSL